LISAKFGADLINTSNVTSRKTKWVLKPLCTMVDWRSYDRPLVFLWFL